MTTVSIDSKMHSAQQRKHDYWRNGRCAQEHAGAMQPRATLAVGGLGAVHFTGGQATR